MNKKIIICLILCLVILLSIVIVAYATNINAIKPDTSTIIVGVTNQEVPITGPLPIYNAGPNTIVVIPQESLDGQYINPITGQPIPTPTPTITPTPSPEITPKTATDETELTDLQMGIYILVNKERVTLGINNVDYNFDLQEAADLRAQEASEKFSHTRPNGQDCYSVFPDYKAAGENLIYADEHIATPQTLMNNWMNSIGHKRNILNKDFTGIAIGVYEKDGVIFVSQLFIG